MQTTLNDEPDRRAYTVHKAVMAIGLTDRSAVRVGPLRSLYIFGRLGTIRLGIMSKTQFESPA